MTEQALREKVVAYMKKQAAIEWTPEKTFISFNPGKVGTKMFSIFKAGTTYYGLPYINFNMAEAETFEKWRHDTYIPFTGTEEQLNNMQKTADLIAIGGEILDSAVKNAFSFPGNDCIASVLMAWNTVINNRAEVQKMQTVSSSIPGKKTGVVAVGEYDYSDTFDDNTDEMTKYNGIDVMSKAYSCLKPGDAVVYIRKNNGNARHIRLVIELPHIEYAVSENGEKILDTEKSYITILDQAGGSSVRFIKGENRSSFRVVNFTFNQLFEEGSLPISIPELTEDGAYVEEKTEIEGFKYDNGEFKGKITTNRQLISARAVITCDGEKYECDGGVVMTDGKTYTNYHLAEYGLDKFNFSNIEFKEGKDYSFELYVLTSGNDGNEICLVKDFVFKA